MKEQYIEELFRVENTNWWHVAKRAQVLDMARRYFPPDGSPALEEGAGAGRLLMDIRDAYGTAVGVDMSNAALSACKQRGLSMMVNGDAEKGLPFSDDTFRLVVFSDVLEHLKNHENALHEAARVIKPGGGIVLSVPAMPWMYSYWDKEHGHQRRYTKPQLRELVADAGFDILKLSYTNFFILPPAIMVRKLFKGQEEKPGGASKDMVMAPAFLNSVFAVIYSIERAAVSAAGLPAGLSLICAARKK